ncbi:hypothetical protein AKO1_012071 [Acrasis kona]|uniref:Uncharacterized protein n=1 Tax=Acrasis kona TaxID=1008807 RepID=A0AAW2Z9X5_9EUKA
MFWYSNKALAVALYGFTASLFVVMSQSLFSLLVTVAVRKFAKDVSQTKPIQYGMHFERYVSLFWFWCVIMLISVSSQVRSLYPVLFFTVFTSWLLLAMLIDRLFVWQQVKKYQYVMEEDHMDRLLKTHDIIKENVGKRNFIADLFLLDGIHWVVFSYIINIIPILFMVDFLERLVRLMVPIAGRSMKNVPPDVILATLIFLVVFLCLVNLLPTLQRSGYELVLCLLLLVAMVVCVIVACVSKPYGPNSPKRVGFKQYADHAFYVNNRTTHGVIHQPSQLSLTSFDYIPIERTISEYQKTETINGLRCTGSDTCWIQYPSPFGKGAFTGVEVYNYITTLVEGVPRTSFALRVEHQEASFITIQTNTSVVMRLDNTDPNFQSKNYVIERDNFITKFSTESNFTVLTLTYDGSYDNAKVRFVINYCEPGQRAPVDEFRKVLPYITPFGYGTCTSLTESSDIYVLNHSE